MDILRSWIKLEKYFTKLTNENVGSSTNLLITGTKGVGKTTLTKGWKVIIDKNSVNVATIDIDYEMVYSKLLPSQNLLQFDHAMKFDPDTFDAFSRKISLFSLVMKFKNFTKIYQDLRL